MTPLSVTKYGSIITNYYYSGLDLLYTKDGSGSIIEQNILEPDGSMICSKRADDNHYWYRQDIRGSVTNIVDVVDNLIKSYTYAAYGNTSSTGTFVNSFAYTGAVIDAEIGLYYMNARYYDPATGRFISEDTYRGDGEAFWHLYLYCNGDPVNNTDPTGHRLEEGSGVGDTKTETKKKTKRAPVWKFRKVKIAYDYTNFLGGRLYCLYLYAKFKNVKGKYSCVSYDGWYTFGFLSIWQASDLKEKTYTDYDKNGNPLCVVYTSAIFHWGLEIGGAGLKFQTQYRKIFMYINNKGKLFISRGAHRLIDKTS